MASEKIKVCHNARCKNQGSELLIQDIEEIVHGRCKVQICGCLGKCGMGPNVEIETNGVPEIHSGIDSFKNMIALVDEVANFEISPDLARISRIKYDARRTEDPGKRTKMLEDCIKKLDKDKDSEFHTKLKADVFVMRSKNQILAEPKKALADAEAAVELAPTWAQSLLALATACEAIDYPIRALEAAEKALRTGMCFDKAAVKKMISRLGPLAKQEGKNPELYRSNPSSPKTPDAAIVAAAKEKEYPSNIFAKMGGRPKFRDLAYKVHEAMFVHASTGHFFPPTIDNSRITERNVDFLVGAFGGPKYKGPDMVITHEFLRINNEQYDVMMDCYKTAMKDMKLHEMFSIPINRQLEGMRSSIVYNKARPGPLARKYDGHLEKHRISIEKDKTKKKKDASNDASLKESASATKTAVGKTATPASPQTKPAAKAKVMAKAKPKANSSPSKQEKEHAAPAVSCFVSDASTKAPLEEDSQTSGDTLGEQAPAGSIPHVDAPAPNEDAVKGDAGGDVGTCPVSGRIAAESTCPFFAILGMSPKTAALLKVLRDAGVPLAHPEAEPTSPYFGIISM